MEHAKLSASGSHRWIRCPGSVKAEEGLLDTSNKYSEEGSLAHDLAERMFFNKDYSDLNVTEEMVGYVKYYVDYLRSIWGIVYIETKVDFSHIVPEGFGTADAIVIKHKIFGDDLHIIDLKYGKGVKVEAYENTQLLLYAIGVLNRSYDIDVNNIDPDRIEFIHLEIVQPRLNHKSKWTISMATLKHWGGYLKAKAEEALKPNAFRTPSEIACQWCKANATCLALHNFTDEIISDNLENPEDMTDEDTKKVLDNSKLISSFIKNVEERVYNHILTGNILPGYKLVNGGKRRKLILKSEEILVELLGERAYTKSLVGVLELEKLLDKETLDYLVYFSNNRPLLVKEEDKREAIILGELKFNPVES